MKAAAATLLALAVSACASTAAGASCDRACLGGQLSAYLDAVTSHDMSKAKTAANFRATENGLETAKGQGVAKTLTGLGEHRRYFDPVTGQAVYMGIAQEGAEPVMITIRLRVQDGAISESETIIARKGEQFYSPEGFLAEPPRATTPLPAAERSTRAQMLAIADGYFEGLTRHDGSKVPVLPGCNRYENGTRTTNRPARAAGDGGDAAALPSAAVPAADCTMGFERQTQIHEVVYRRYPMVDEEAGVVLGFALFHRPPGTTLTGNFAKRNLISEYFETKAGKLSRIYAVMHFIEADQADSTGWN